MNATIYSPDEVLKLLKAEDPVGHEEAYLNDDKSDGLLFANLFDRIRFNTTTKLYSVFDGVRWRTDEENLMTEAVAQLLATALYLYLGPVLAKITDEKVREHISKHYYKLGGRGPRQTMLSEARNFRSISMEEMDKNKYLLNVQNGTIDLKSITFREHRAEDLLSCVANVSFNASADCPAFKRFIAEVTSVPDEQGGWLEDRDKAEYLQRLLGYSLIGDCREDEFYLLYGATTRNGKSTLLSVIGDILGDYAEMIEPDALASGRRVNQNDEQIADLRGKRFAHVEEPSKAMIFDTGLIKKLTGRSKLTASRKYEHRFSYMPEFKIFLATNYLPTVLDDSLFKSGRCKVITFERHFDDSEQDKDLREKLKAEAPGILNWMLEGLRAYYEKRTAPPEAVLKATGEYQHISDRIENFMSECTEAAEDRTITLSALYPVYVDWCKSCGYNAEGKQKFSDALRRKRLLVDQKKIKGVSYKNVILNRALVDHSEWQTVTSSPFDT